MTEVRLNTALLICLDTEEFLILVVSIIFLDPNSSIPCVPKSLLNVITPHLPRICRLELSLVVPLYLAMPIF